VSEYRLQFRGTLFPVRAGEITLGRSSYASIVVNNPLASREHAIIRSVGGRLEVVDLGSKNGTMVNGERLVGARRVDVGDKIKIGTDVIEIVRASFDNPRDLRAQTYPGRVQGQAEEGETTVHFRRSIELAEALVAACQSNAQRAPTAEGIVQVINEFWAEMPPSNLDRSVVDRVRRVVDTVGEWNLGPQIEEWRKSVAARLDPS
jgi:hypothetical protein